MTLPCGALVEQLAAGVAAEACLIAPFMKIGTLRRVAGGLPEAVRLMVITRWRPEEIAVGVSDLEVWDFVQARPNSELRLCHELHAKLYRFDDRCAVGSANLTDAGLGWSKAPNLEFLTEVPVAGPAAELEREAILRSSIATIEVYNAMLEVARLLREAQVVKPKLEVPDPPVVRFIDWLPRTRYPAMLERAYRGEWSKLTEATQESAAYDLAALRIPENLTSEQFQGYVGAMLLAHPVVQEIDRFLTRPRRFGELLRKLGQARGVRTADDSTNLQTLQRWLSAFCAARYDVSVPRFTEVLGVRKLDE